MIKSRTLKLAIALILVYTCGLASSNEPNDARTELKFEINKVKSQPWISGQGRRGRGRGPITPTHVAFFYIRRPSENLPSGHEGIVQILNTSAGQSLSKKQRQFLTASDAVSWIGIQDIQNHDQVRIYAVSEEEAKKTAQAYLEVAIKGADEHAQIFKKMRNKAKERIIQIKKELPEKQKQLEAAELKYKEMKKARYLLFNDGQAYEKARETILNIENTLDILEIELAGIQEKMKVLESYRRTKRLPRKALSDETVDKLDLMYIEQIIELSSAKARQKTAFQIRDRENEFLNLFNQWNNPKSEVRALQRNLEFSEKNLNDSERMLVNPGPLMLPPKLYQDTVTIYRVLE